MKLIYQSKTAVHVALSRRNLLKLIEMLDQHVGMPTLQRKDGTVGVIITAEEDADHYKGRS